jgi:predicted  nucleic acid-binding Zn-ribbon protein
MGSSLKTFLIKTLCPMHEINESLEKIYDELSPIYKSIERIKNTLSELKEDYELQKIDVTNCLSISVQVNQIEHDVQRLQSRLDSLNPIKQRQSK